MAECISCGKDIDYRELALGRCLPCMGEQAPSRHGSDGLDASRLSEADPKIHMATASSSEATAPASSSLRIWANTAVVAFFLLLAIAAFYSFGFGGISAQDKFLYTEDCRKWLAEDTPGQTLVHDDFWKKRGKLVFSFRLHDSSDSSRFRTILCVVDREKGTMLRPGLAQIDSWFQD